MESADGLFVFNYLASTESCLPVLYSVMLDHPARYPLLVVVQSMVCNVFPARRHTGHKGTASYSAATIKLLRVGRL